jgi:hypothetical protein
MITPDIRYYAKFELSKDSKKTPKYTITRQAGYYEPMETLKGRDGQISMYLMEKLKEGELVPAMRLQAKGRLNFTGLKDYFVDGKITGFAYGYPDDKPTYSSNKKPNPFYTYKNDGYLFVVCVERNIDKGIIPVSFEMLVLADAKILVPSYCKQLVMGGFDDVLEELRKQSKRVSAI